MRSNTAPAGKTPALEAVRRRREDLGAILLEVRRSLVAPVDGATPSTERVLASLRALREVFGRHVDVTEGMDGLHEEIVSNAPRLLGAVARLHEEHLAIERSIEETIEIAHAGGAVHGRVLGLVDRIEAHRRQGADLVHEVYMVDLGSGE